MGRFSIRDIMTRIQVLKLLIVYSWKVLTNEGLSINTPGYIVHLQLTIDLFIPLVDLMIFVFFITQEWKVDWLN